MMTRINEIADAATYLFLRQGYSKTQISHIAKAVGVSVGTIYNDFVGKKEIMHYILKCTIDPEFHTYEIQTPISDDLFAGLENDIMLMFEKSACNFEMPLKNGMSNYNFEMLISDSFDLLARYAVGCLFIEKNQYDFKFLAEQYKSYRSKFLSVMVEYMYDFIDKGIVRKLDNVELSTILIVEILTWWAMDRKYVSFETSNVLMEDAKKVCMDNIISAYKQ